MKIGLSNSISSNVWNPTSSNGLEFWFARNTGITADSGTKKISSWSNFANPTETMVQATAGEQPQLVGDAVDFDGGDNLQSSTQYTFTGSFVIGIIFEIEDADASNDVLVGDNTSSNNFLRLNDTNTVAIKTTGSARSLDIDTPAAFAQDTVYSFVYARDGSDVCRCWINGVLQVDTVTSAGDFLVDAIGVRATDLHDFSGKMWELIAYKDNYSLELVGYINDHLERFRTEML